MKRDSRISRADTRFKVWESDAIRSTQARKRRVGFIRKAAIGGAKVCGRRCTRGEERKKLNCTKAGSKEREGERNAGRIGENKGEDEGGRGGGKEGVTGKSKTRNGPGFATRAARESKGEVPRAHAPAVAQVGPALEDETHRRQLHKHLQREEHEEDQLELGLDVPARQAAVAGGQARGQP
eukprot:2341168-Pleurochrysis_carterae.AAC.2